MGGGQDAWCRRRRGDGYEMVDGGAVIVLWGYILVRRIVIDFTLSYMMANHLF